MANVNPATITVEAVVHSPVELVWEYWTDPKHITQWNSASDDWHTPYAENDLKAGGKFVSRMEAKDGSVGFDFSGVYDEVSVNERIAYTMPDGRKVQISFVRQGNAANHRIVRCGRNPHNRDAASRLASDFRQFQKVCRVGQKVNRDVLVIEARMPSLACALHCIFCGTKKAFANANCLLGPSGCRLTFTPGYSLGFSCASFWPMRTGLPIFTSSAHSSCLDSNSRMTVEPNSNQPSSSPFW